MHHQVGQPPPPLPSNQEIQHRPPLARIDSRSTLIGPQNYPPNQPVRFPVQPIRPGGGPQQFIPRTPPNQNQQRPPQPFNQNPSIRNPGVRQIGPFPRPPLQQGPRFAYQQRPQGQIRPNFNAEQKLQKLDSIESSDAYKYSGSKYDVESEEQKAALITAMKNRSYSVTEERAKGIEERRYSVSSTGSVEGGKFQPVQARPDLQFLATAVEQQAEKVAKTESNKPIDSNGEKEKNGKQASNLPVNSYSANQGAVANQLPQDVKTSGNTLNEHNILQDKLVVSQTGQKEVNLDSAVLVKAENESVESREIERKIESPKSNKIDEINNSNIKTKVDSHSKEAVETTKTSKNVKEEYKNKKEIVQEVKRENVKGEDKNKKSSTQEVKKENVKVEDKNKNGTIQEIKKETVGLPKGWNTPDLKIPLKRKSATKKG